MKKLIDRLYGIYLDEYSEIPKEEKQILEKECKIFQALKKDFPQEKQKLLYEYDELINLRHTKQNSSTFQQGFKWGSLFVLQILGFDVEL